MKLDFEKKRPYILAKVNVYAVARPSVCRLLSVTLLHPTQPVKFSVMFVRHLVPWPSIDIQIKFYGDRPREPLRRAE